MKNYWVWSLGLFFSLSMALAQDGHKEKPKEEKKEASATTEVEEEIPEVEIPLGEMCRLEASDQEKQIPLQDCPDCQKKVEATGILEEMTLDMKSILSGKLPSSKDNCKSILQMGKLVGDEPVIIHVKDNQEKKWKIKFYFGNNKTWYGKTTARIKTSRLDLTIKDLQPYERRSDSFYQFWNWPLKDAFRWIDEPTNTFKFTVEHKKNEFSLSIFHPKYLFVEGDQEFTGKQYQNENVYVKGTADGYAVDGRMKLKGDFAPDPNKAFIPGNVYFVSWENSHKLLQPELGYGRTVDLIKSKGKPIVTWTPSVSAGVFLGILNSTYSKYDKRYEFDDYEEENKMKVMGVTGSIGNKIVVHDRKDRIGAFVEHKFTYAKKKYAFLDGTAEHDLTMNTLNFGVQVTLLKKK